MGSRGSARPPIPSGGEIPNGGERTLTTRGGGNLDFPKEVKTHTKRGVGGPHNQRWRNHPSGHFRAFQKQVVKMLKSSGAGDIVKSIFADPFLRHRRMGKSNIRSNFRGSFRAQFLQLFSRCHLTVFAAVFAAVFAVVFAAVFAAVVAAVFAAIFAAVFAVVFLV